MSFSPVVPFGGYAGWAFLTRTRETQQKAFVDDPSVRRDTDYFRARIGSVTTAGALVSDRRLLKVALGAFGIDADINNRFFIQKVLDDGTLKPDALANKLADKRYLEMSRAFGFGDYAIPSTRLSGFADRIVTAFETRQFETAVGRQDDTMRLALNAEREFAMLAGKNLSNDTKWYSIMGSAPLRNVMETAMGLPQSFASIDLDQQLAVFKDRAERFFGTAEISQFADREKIEKMLRLFLLRSADRSAGGVSGQSAALNILQSGPSEAVGLLSSPG